MRKIFFFIAALCCAVITTSAEEITEVALTISQFPKLNETVGENSFAASVPEGAGYEINNNYFEYYSYNGAIIPLENENDVFTAGTYLIEIPIWPKEGFAFPANEDGWADGFKITMTVNGEEPYGWSGRDEGLPVLFLEAEFTISDPTGIEGIQHSEFRTQKVVRDGQLFILRGDKVYTVTGQEVK